MVSDVTVLPRQRPPLTAEENALLDSVRPQLLAWAKALGKRHAPLEQADFFQIGMEYAINQVSRYNPAEGSFLTFIYSGAHGAMFKACCAEFKAQTLVKAIHRGTVLAHDAMRVGNLFADEGDRRVHAVETRYALVAGAILGIFIEASSPEEEFFLEEERNRLRGMLNPALAMLDEEDRALVLSHVLEGTSLAEMGRRLGIDADRARYRYNRALTRLGHLINKKQMARP